MFKNIQNVSVSYVTKEEFETYVGEKWEDVTDGTGTSNFLTWGGVPASNHINLLVNNAIQICGGVDRTIKDAFDDKGNPIKIEEGNANGFSILNDYSIGEIKRATAWLIYAQRNKSLPRNEMAQSVNSTQGQITHNIQAFRYDGEWKALPWQTRLHLRASQVVEIAKGQNPNLAVRPEDYVRKDELPPQQGGATNFKGLKNDTTIVADNGREVIEKLYSYTETNENNIQTNKNDIVLNTTNITNNKSNIETNKNDIATNTTGIATNKTNIETNKTNISTNTTDIETNKTNISINTSKVVNLDDTGKVVNAPTNDKDIATKKYVDENSGGGGIPSDLNKHIDYSVPGQIKIFAKDKNSSDKQYNMILDVNGISLNLDNEKIIQLNDGEIVNGKELQMSNNQIKNIAEATDDKDVTTLKQVKKLIAATVKTEPKNLPLQTFISTDNSTPADNTLKIIQDWKQTTDYLVKTYLFGTRAAEPTRLEVSPVLVDLVNASKSGLNIKFTMKSNGWISRTGTQYFQLGGRLAGRTISETFGEQPKSTSKNYYLSANNQIPYTIIIKLEKGITTSDFIYFGTKSPVMREASFQSPYKLEIEGMWYH